MNFGAGVHHRVSAPSPCRSSPAAGPYGSYQPGGMPQHMGQRVNFPYGTGPLPSYEPMGPSRGLSPTPPVRSGELRRPSTDGRPTMDPFVPRQPSMERIDPHSGPRLSMEPQPLGSGRQSSRGPMGRGNSPQPGSARFGQHFMSQGMARAASPTRGGLAPPPPLHSVCPQLATAMGAPPPAPLQAQPAPQTTPVKHGYGSTSKLATVNSSGDLLQNATPRRSLVHIGSGPNGQTFPGSARDGRGTPRGSLVPVHLQQNQPPLTSPGHPQPGLPLAPAAMRGDSVGRAGPPLAKRTSCPAPVPMGKDFCVIDPDTAARRASMEQSTRLMDGNHTARTEHTTNKENSISNIQREDSIHNHEPKKTIEASTISVDGLKSAELRETAKHEAPSFQTGLETQRTIPVHDVTSLSPRLPELLAEKTQLEKTVRELRTTLQAKDVEIATLKQCSDEASVVVGLSPMQEARQMKDSAKDSGKDLLRACQRIDALEKELEDGKRELQELRCKNISLEDQLDKQTLEADEQQSCFNSKMSAISEELERNIARALEAEKSAATEKDHASAQSTEVKKLRQELQVLRSQLESDRARQPQVDDAKLEDTARTLHVKAQKENEQLRQMLQNTRTEVMKYEKEFRQDRHLAATPADFARAARQMEAQSSVCQSYAEARMHLEQCKEALRAHVPVPSRRAADSLLQGVQMVWDTQPQLLGPSSPLPEH